MGRSEPELDVGQSSVVPNRPFPAGALAIYVLIGLLVTAVVVVIFATWTTSSGNKPAPKVVVPAKTQ
jgi:hypothetical protein